MYRSSYSDVLDHSSGNVREAERGAILQSIKLLEKAEAAGVNSREAINALLYVRRLWEFFVLQLADSENQLPKKLRADLISVGLGILKEAEALARKEFEELCSFDRDFTNRSRRASMTKPFNISLKAGEKIFVNGAVLRVDRKVSLEFLNDVTFLLEAHVMQPEQTRTPLRQLYFIIQSMLIDPMNVVTTKTVFDSSYPNVYDAMPKQELRSMLREVRQSVEARRYYDALKILRNYFPMEDAIFSSKELLGAE